MRKCDVQTLGRKEFEHDSEPRVGYAVLSGEFECPLDKGLWLRKSARQPTAVLPLHLVCELGEVGDLLDAFEVGGTKRQSILCEHPRKAPFQSVGADSGVRSHFSRSLGPGGAYRSVFGPSTAFTDRAAGSWPLSVNGNCGRSYM